MREIKIIKFITLSLFCALSFAGKGQQKENTLPGWQKGFLDIHFIETGRGNASFMVFPDGTTLLVDAGDLDAVAFEKRHAPLKVSPALPNNTRRTGEWIAAYIRQVMPSNRKGAVDYALVTHFHEDHYGTVKENSPQSADNTYQLSGITDVGTQLTIKKMLDRGRSYPTDLLNYYKKNRTFANYIKFIEAQRKNGLQYESLQAGSSKQIHMLFDAESYPGFLVRNIKSGNEVWTGSGETSYKCFADSIMPTKGFNENPLSAALKISYGNFSFYTGGDNTGYEGPAFPGCLNVETAIAKAVGKVTTMSLNHHGNRDANNDSFIKALSPAIAVEQSWCSDQPGQELAFRLTQKDDHGTSIHVFNTYMLPETQVYMGAWITEAFKSLRGHVVIRVLKGGSEYLVFVLNEASEKLKIIKTFGPYKTNPKS